MKKRARVKLVQGLFACIAVQGSATAVARADADVPSHVASFADHQRQCAGKDGWSDPAPPIRIFANIYDVGTCGIVVLLIAGPDGHILIDAATAQAVPGIVANIERLGFRPTDIKLLLTSHEHFDHVGGLHDLQRRTGGRVVATAAARPVLETGVAGQDDPQRAILPAFNGVRVNRVVGDDDVVILGPLRLTAHRTPGHSLGGTSWSWRSCNGGMCHSVVYADSLRATAAKGYRFSNHPKYVAAFRATLAKVARLPCDLIVTPHPSASALYERLSGAAPLSTSGACKTYAAEHAARLDRTLAGETPRR